MVKAIDTVLGTYGNRSLATEFPKFTWNNYFMITGTYDIQVTNVYTNLKTLPPTFTGPEWKLFRSWLKDGREKWQEGKAGVLVEQLKSYPNNNLLLPSQGTPVERYGVAYTEFLTNTSLVANGVLSVTLDVELPLSDAQQYARVSVLPLTSFATVPNTFIAPQTAYLPDKTVSRYTFRIADFAQCNRVALLINNLGSTKLSYTYAAEVVPPTGLAPGPCSLLP